MSRRLLVLAALLLPACLQVDGGDADDDEEGVPGPRGGDADGGQDSGVDAGDGGADGGDGGGDGGGGEAGDGGAEDDPADPAESCHPDVEGWPEQWAAYEDRVLTLTNEARAQGQDCGSQGRMPAVPALAADPWLRCAARYHSLWMAETGTFDHTSQGGDLGSSPWDRMASAGFSGSGTGENIAAGYTSPEQVVQGWLDSDGHCANLMSSSATLLGVGYAEGGPYGTYWTQDFGR